MGSILAALLGPGKGILSGVGELIDKFQLDPAKKLEAQQALLQMEADYQQKVMEVSVQLAQSQASVITSESKSGNWLAASWRPILMLTFTFIVAYNYVIAPIFSLKSLAIVPDMWELLRLGIGGYIAGRSLEKIAPSITSALKK